MSVIHPLRANLIIWQLSVPHFWSIIFLRFKIHGKHGFCIQSPIQFLFKIKLTGVGIMAEYILKSVKFSHRHNISFIWLAENIHKNPNIFWSKIFLISQCHTQNTSKMQSFGSNVCSYQFLSHRLFRSQDVGAWCFLFSPKGFLTGVEMTECELDKFLYRHSLSLRSIKDRFLLLWE